MLQNSLAILGSWGAPDGLLAASCSLLADSGLPAADAYRFKQILVDSGLLGPMLADSGLLGGSCWGLLAAAWWLPGLVDSGQALGWAWASPLVSSPLACSPERWSDAWAALGGLGDTWNLVAAASWSILEGSWGRF